MITFEEKDLQSLIGNDFESIVIYGKSDKELVFYNSQSYISLMVQESEFKSWKMDALMRFFAFTENELHSVQGDIDFKKNTLTRNVSSGEILTVKVLHIKLNNKDCVCFKWSVNNKNDYIINQDSKITRLRSFLDVLDMFSSYNGNDDEDFKSFLRSVSPQISKTLGVNRVSIRLYDLKKSELISYSLYDERNIDSIKGIPLKRKDYPDFFKYIETESLIKIDNISDNKDLIPMIDVFFSKDGVIKSLLSSRITLNREVLGYVFFQSIEANKWESEHVLFAGLVSNQIAIINANNQLNQQQLVLEEQIKIRTNELQKAKVFAEEANKAKSYFVSKVSHEIRTPLTTIIGFLSLIDENKLDVRTRTYFNNINQGAHILHDLINDVLDFSKIENDAMVPTLDHSNIDELVMYVESFFLEMFDEKNLDFIVQSNMRNKSFVTDIHFLYQIINNLVSNALKFTTKGPLQ